MKTKEESSVRRWHFSLPVVSRALRALLCIKCSSENCLSLFFSKQLNCIGFILEVSCPPGKHLCLPGNQSPKKCKTKTYSLFAESQQGLCYVRNFHRKRKKKILSSDGRKFIVRWIINVTLWRNSAQRVPFPANVVLLTLWFTACIRPWLTSP